MPDPAATLDTIQVLCGVLAVTHRNEADDGTVWWEILAFRQSGPDGWLIEADEVTVAVMALAEAVGFTDPG